MRWVRIIQVFLQTSYAYALPKEALARTISTGNVAAKSAVFESAATSTAPKKPSEAIKKPPRKSKLPEATFRQTNNNNANDLGPRRFKKNGEDIVNEAELAAAEMAPNNNNKRFKMLRLNNRSELSPSSNDCGEMGIVISKRRHPQKGTTGYVIAHIEQGGIAERYDSCVCNGRVFWGPSKKICIHATWHPPLS